MAIPFNPTVIDAPVRRSEICPFFIIKYQSSRNITLSTGLNWLRSEIFPQTGSIPKMGVPKFFRWMSERYPAISQVIASSRIPEFDCLYLDMNGIIHNCTHSDSDSPTFRMTEDQMFIRIFNYIEHLFGIIQPKHLFFMAIDGVAPRAKMNQQRARRFRTALDAERAKEMALREGISLPKEAAFDSNCITPGKFFNEFS